MPSSSAAARTAGSSRSRFRVALSHPFLFPALGLFVLLFTAVWSQTRVDRLIQRLDAARESQALLESRMEALSRQADHSAGWSRVEERAIRERGLVSPAPEQLVEIHFHGFDTPDAADPGLDGIVPAAYAGRPESRGTSR